MTNTYHLIGIKSELPSQGRAFEVMRSFPGSGKFVGPDIYFGRYAHNVKPPIEGFDKEPSRVHIFCTYKNRRLYNSFIVDGLLVLANPHHYPNVIASLTEEQLVPLPASLLVPIIAMRTVA